MVDDGFTSPRELFQILLEAGEVCEDNLSNATNPKHSVLNGNLTGTYCPGEWDNIICWPDSPPGPVKVKCPDYIVDFKHDAYAKRYCNLNGTWLRSLKSPNKTWVNFDDCQIDGLIKEDIADEIRNGGIGPQVRSLVQLYTVGYSFSLVALTFAMFILAYFQRLHCTRNYIHMHLFASFMLRAIVIFVKDRVLFIGSGIIDIQTSSAEQPTLEELMVKIESPPGGESYRVGCKIVITLFHYFLATNYYWILVEALYLHSLIFVAFFSDKKYLWRFTLTGWGVPVLFVVPWAIVRGTLHNNDCWDIPIAQYKWIYSGPIVVANVVNFLLFLNIIRVLWYKMRERGAINRSDNRRQYRKLAKSTLVLIPMFGVHAIVFIGMPDTVTHGVWWNIRMYFDLFFNSFQGFFVAIIYCFCNGEVQAEFRKAWERFNLSVEMQRGNRDRSRSSVTMLSSFNSSVSQQARWSIAGQGNRRNSNITRNSCQTTANNNNNRSSVTTSLEANGLNSNDHKALLSDQSKPEVNATLLKGSPRAEIRNGDFLLNLGEDEHLAPFASNKNNPVSLPMILSIREEDPFEIAMEKNLATMDDGEKIDGTDTETKDDVSAANSLSESNRNSMCGTDSDATTSSSCKRIPSFDSGISSMHGANSRNYSNSLPL